MEFASAVPETVKFLVARLAPLAGDKITGNEGFVVSITMFLLELSEFAALGTGNVKLAVLLAESRIVPPFKAKLEVDR